MVETLSQQIGILLTITLTVYISYLRPGWQFTLATAFFGSLAAYELPTTGASSLAPVLISVITAVFGGVLLRRAWGIALLALMVCVIMAPAVTHARGGVSEFDATPPVQLSTTAVACLFAVAVLALGAYRHSALICAIQEVREVNRRLWDGSSNGIILVDFDGRVAEWNPAMERLTGLTRRSVVGTVLTEYPPFGGSLPHKECFRLAKQGIETASDAIPGYFPPGDSSFRAYYSPLPNQKGNTARVLVVITPNEVQYPLAAPRQVDRVEIEAA
jgi:PAS domain-containing protein